ncbi:glycosyltransferase family 2 protein [Campylobacter corcagiensis]|nr:glycosyltransferase family 2 protein [Campylobacter corcagiensis]QKF64176.1 glycosyltransferase, family 2 [Campylobacter corcagiensis]
MNPLVSIIVPVYNNEKYLKKCVDSLLLQTYKNIEIILINDGSVDKSREICDEFSKFDNRVKVIHQQNLGVGAARNAGLEAMSGEFFCFVDSDDSVKSDYVKYMVENIKNNGIVIIPIYKNLTNEYELNSKDALRKLIYDGGEIYGWAPWGKLFRREFLGDIRFFTNHPVGQDFTFVYKMILASKSVKFALKPCYIYNNTSTTSVSNQNFSAKHDKLLLTCDEFIEFTKENYPGLLIDSYYYKAYSLVLLIKRSYPKKEYQKKYKNMLFRLLPKVFINKNISLKAKFWFVKILLKAKI